MSLKFIANRPWLITEPAFQLVAAVASRDEIFADVRLKALAMLEGSPLENKRQVTKAGDVAVIPIEGPLFRKADLLSAVSGAASYESISSDLHAMLADPTVGSIVLAFDSPGGEANGVSELASAIFEARKQKPIKAYVAGSAGSAAYWLASACGELVCADTGSVGCLGAMSIYAKDDGPTDKVTFISSQTPNKNASPTSDKGRALIQERTDALAAVFIDSVAKYRNVTPDAVLKGYGKGDMFVGDAARKAGMVDRISTMAGLVASMRGALTGTMTVPPKSAASMSFAEFGQLEVTL